MVTALVYGIPPVLFAYPLPGAAIFAAAIIAMSALAICILFALRHQRSGNRTDLIIAALFGAVALIEGVLPIVAEPVGGTADIAFWARVISRTLVAIGLCVAAWLPERARRPVRHPLTVVAAASVAVAGVAIVWTFASMSSLPATVDDTVNQGAVLMRSQNGLTIRLVTSLVLLLAVVGLARKARQLGDPALDWLAAGTVVLATARFHDYLFPSLHNDWVTTGDMLRVVAAWLILFGLFEEIAKIWQRRGVEAQAEERRNLAAELHDGLAQELACLTTHSALAEHDPTNREHLAQVRLAAERALSEARLCIADYAESDPVALDVVIAELGHDVEAEYGCRVALDLEAVRVHPRTAHELRRVAREALSNAARHGHPDEIVVHLDAHAGLVRLSIVDNGTGLTGPSEGSDVDRFAYGLTSMRNRAERLGGYCSIDSLPLDGTRVAIEVPAR